MSLSHHYADDLPEGFSTLLTPAPPPAPKLIALNEPLAAGLGLDPAWLASAEGIALLTHGRRPDGRAPVAMVYAGHQFGQFVPRLGDGRALLAGELRDRQGTLVELHLKGSGPTPFSRGGDGKAPLGAVLREYLLSEAMAALGIPTTRSLAALTTGETVMRERPLPGAILARTAYSHVRVGTFQYFAARGEIDALKSLADHVIGRLYPELLGLRQPYPALLRAIMRKQAQLIARWMLVGFIHGVMNTDNMAVSGETLDYGPAAFLDDYDPGKVFSFIDRDGRYAFGRQPQMGLWNLSRLAETLLPLFSEEPEQAIGQARDILKEFDALFGEAFLQGWRAKLGLARPEAEDARLLDHLLEIMQECAADFTLTFRALSTAALTGDYAPVREQFHKHPGLFDLWRIELLFRLERENRSPEERHAAMKRVNPRVIPRHHLVEKAVSAAPAGDYALYHQLRDALSHPFDDGEDGFDRAPAPQERVQYSFCGT